METYGNYAKYYSMKREFWQLIFKCDKQVKLQPYIYFLGTEPYFSVGFTSGLSWTVSNCFMLCTVLKGVQGSQPWSIRVPLEHRGPFVPALICRLFSCPKRVADSDTSILLKK